MDYSLEERIQIIKWYYSTSSTERVSQLFVDAFKERPIPSSETVLMIVTAFETSGCVDYCIECRTNENEDNTLATNVPHEHTMNNKSTTECDDQPSRNQTQYGLKRNKQKSLKVQKTVDICPEDKFKRLEFCNAMLQQINHNQNFLKNILFTGESTFSINRHQDTTTTEARYWAKKDKPVNLESTKMQALQKVVMWAGLLDRYVVGPIFIEDNLNAEKYLCILQNNIIPKIKSLNIDLNKVWLCHDGKPAHNAKSLQSFMKQTFSERIIGGNGSIVWPARSADLSPNGFFTLGYIKQKLYCNMKYAPKNTDELQSRIRDILQNITPEMISEVREEFLNRLKKCQAQKGGEIQT